MNLKDGRRAPLMASAGQILEESHLAMDQPLTRNGLSEEAARYRDVLGLPIELLPSFRQSTPRALHADSLAVNGLIAGRAADEICKAFLGRYLPPPLFATVEPFLHLNFSALWMREELQDLMNGGLLGLHSRWRERAQAHALWAPSLEALRKDRDFGEIWGDLPCGDFDMNGRGKDYTVGMEYYQAARSFGADSLLSLLRGNESKGATYLDVLGGDGYLLRLQEARRKLGEKHLLVLEVAEGFLDFVPYLEEKPAEAARLLEHLSPGTVLLAVETIRRRDGPPRKGLAVTLQEGAWAKAALDIRNEDLAALGSSPAVLWLECADAHSYDEIWEEIRKSLDRKLVPRDRSMILTNDISLHMFLSAGLWGLPTREDARHLTRTFHPNSLAGVLFAYGTHHVEGLEEAIQESFRIIKPEGRIVVHDFIDEGRIGRWFHEVVDRYCRTGHDFDHIGPVELATSLLMAGFQDIELYEMEDPFVFAVSSDENADAREVACSYLLRMYGMVENFGHDRESFESLVRDKLFYPEIGNEPVFTENLVYIPRRAVVACARRPARAQGGYSASDLKLILNLEWLLQASPQEILQNREVPPEVVASWFGDQDRRWGMSVQRQERWFRWLSSIRAGALTEAF